MSLLISTLVIFVFLVTISSIVIGCYELWRPRYYLKLTDMKGNSPIAIPRIPYNLPKGGEPGDWMPRIEGKLIQCDNGYHVCKPDDVREFYPGTKSRRLFLVQVKGIGKRAWDKSIFRSIRFMRELPLPPSFENEYDRRMIYYAQAVLACQLQGEAFITSLGLTKEERKRLVV